MEDRLRVSLDTSVLFAAVLSPTGGARAILRLGEIGVIDLLVGKRVLQEADTVLTRKAPESKPVFALLLDRAGISIGPGPNVGTVERAKEVIDYSAEALILAEALAANIDYFVTLDRRHFVENPHTADLPFPVGTPGDFLAWFREAVEVRYDAEFEPSRSDAERALEVAREVHKRVQRVLQESTGKE